MEQPGYITIKSKSDKKKIHFDFNNFINFIPDILKSIKG